VILYHGGPRGLRRILPPSVTGAPSCVDYGAGHVARRDRVYLTTEIEAARLLGAHAPFHGPCAVYEVEPEGELEHDPDCDTPGLSWQCPSARVIRVAMTISQSARHRILRAHQRTLQVSQ
jgi:hypothetical protein